MQATVVRNEDVSRVVAFIPPGHAHIRLLIEIGGRALILQEATVAAIVRAYISVATHPVRRAVELVAARPQKLKPGFAEHQLVESGKPEDKLLEEVLEIWAGARPLREQPE